MKPVHILLVEDNEGDILLTREALENANIINRLTVVKDGKDAIDFLNKEGKYQDATEPDILLLDINLPRRNGHEVLKYIKTDINLKHIPVVMLSTSSAESDIYRSYANHANCYITKPVESENLLKIISQVQNFWGSIVKLPVKNNY